MRNGKKGLLMILCSVGTAVLMVLWPVEQAALVQTAAVQRGELVQSLLLIGTVRYVQEQPCVSLKSGTVSRVYVKAGQPIRQGELLFQMDTTAEEQALAALQKMRYEHKNALAQLNDTVAVLALQNELEWQTTEAELLARIKASQIRAAADGMMEAVYVRDGDLVAETGLLGTTRGSGVQIAAAAYAASLNGISVGDAAIAAKGDSSIPVVVHQVGAADAAGMQTVYFRAADDTLNGFETGDTVQVELATAVRPVSAMVPLAAVSADETVWCVEEGKVFEYEIAIGERSRTHGEVEWEYADKMVVLYPDQHQLKNGMPVQVSK